MIDLSSLIKNTNAYKSVLSDKKAGKLSHAYLVVGKDGENLEEILKVFAKLLVCESVEPCDVCRACKGTDAKSFADVYFYPNGKPNVSAEDVNGLIEETYLRPIEGDKKVFVINHGEALSQVVQNKLLKTLEEPPKNVHIIIGATSEYPLLQTVKSRLKRLEIPPFSDEALYSAMEADFEDKQKLKQAISYGDGTVGKAKFLYGEENFTKINEFVFDMVINMKSSKDVLDFSEKLQALNCDISDLLSSLELFYRDMLAYLSVGESAVKNKDNLNIITKAEGYKIGSVISILESINEGALRKKFNANSTMLIEWLLFKILEGKHKWQKL